MGVDFKYHFKFIFETFKERSNLYLCYLKIKFSTKFDERQQNKKLKARFGNIEIEIPYSIDAIVALKEIFLDKLYNSLSKLENVLDLGGFLGESAVFFALTNKKVVVVEPDPDYLPFLKSNISNYSNIVFINKAVVGTTNSSSSKLFKNQIFDDGGSLSQIYSGSQTLEVETISISEVVQNYGPFDGIKIDIEGSEFEILEFFLQNRDLFSFQKGIIEFHFSNIDLERNLDTLKSFLNFLKENDYQFTTFNNFSIEDFMENSFFRTQEAPEIFILEFSKVN
jgi:FkbM family methyltransferase